MIQVSFNSKNYYKRSMLNNTIDQWVWSRRIVSVAPNGLVEWCKVVTQLVVWGHQSLYCGCVDGISFLPFCVLVDCCGVKAYIQYVYFTVLLYLFICYVMLVCKKVAVMYSVYEKRCSDLMCLYQNEIFNTTVSE